MSEWVQLGIGGLVVLLCFREMLSFLEKRRTHGASGNSRSEVAAAERMNRMSQEIAEVRSTVASLTVVLNQPENGIVSRLLYLERKK